MKKIVWTSLCAALACATSVIAQTTSPPQTSPSATDQKTIVVTGCLKEAPSNTMPAATGTTGTAGATSEAAAAPAYVLANATTGAPADTSAVPGATGTTGSTSPASAGQTYRLIANASALTPHVGKKLELTGLLENSRSAASGEPSTTADRNANGPTLRVQSGRIVGASCTE